MNEVTEPGSAAAPLAERITRRSRAMFFLFSLRTIIAVVSVAATVVMVWRTWDLDKETQALRNENTYLHFELDQTRHQVELEEGANQVLIEKVKKLEKEVDAMVPPTNDKLFTILSQGLGVTEVVRRTTNVSTTPAAAFAVDLTVTQQSDAFTQEMLIQNTHATQNLCVGSLAWVTNTTCQATCAASALTCSGAATDGWMLSAGQAREFREDGTNCVCVVGSAASTTYQDERAIR